MNLKKFPLKMIAFGSVVAQTLRYFSRLLTKAFTKPAAAKRESESAAFDAIDDYIEDQMRHLNIPGAALAIVVGDQIVHQRGFGRARPNGETPTPQTPFFIGSLTKSFTALAIMQLVEAGEVELDAPVQRYLPWFRLADLDASAQITVRHLLNQTSGLPQSAGMITLANFDGDPGATQRQVLDLSQLKLSRPIGSKFEYSNTNYNLLGLIVEAASRESYADYIQRHIFDPLDMRHSYSTQAAAQQHGLAVGHRYWFGHPVPAHNLSIPTGSLPSGQLISSTKDMAHYLIAHLNQGRYGEKQILSAAGIDEMHRAAVEYPLMGKVIAAYGMGWFSQEIGGSKVVSHGGTVPDFGAFMALIPEQNKGIVLFFNANHMMMKIILDEVGLGAAQRLAGQHPSTPPFVAVLWAMRAVLLIPIIQITGVAATMRRLRQWTENPELRPTGRRMWGRHILLPSIANGLVALSLVTILGKMRGFLMLFMPDVTWLALICGSFAGIWTFLRTGLILRAMRNSRDKKPKAKM